MESKQAEIKAKFEAEFNSLPDASKAFFASEEHKNNCKLIYEKAGGTQQQQHNNNTTTTQTMPFLVFLTLWESNFWPCFFLNLGPLSREKVATIRQSFEAAVVPLLTDEIKAKVAIPAE